MKGILIILDGLGDLPQKLLGGKTPLEVAETPNMDFLATRGEMGYLYPVKPGFIPESDEAIVSLFGNELISSTRGQLEAAGSELKLIYGDLAFRVNFASVDFKKKVIIDRRAGRTLTTAEAEVLAKELERNVKLPVNFIFKPTIQHRAVLVLKGGFSDSVSGNDVTYYNQGKVKELEGVRVCTPLDENEDSQYSADIVNEFIHQAYEILDKHPINVERRKKGLVPANYLLVRGAGIEKPKLKQYKNWLSVNYMPLERGFSTLSGMKNFSFDYPKLKKLDVYENLYEGLETACKFFIKIIKKDYNKFDYAYVHFKEIDIPGHDNKPLEKKEMIEYVDKTVFKFLRRFAPPKEIKVVVTGDHSTPCNLKNHSADPVPVLFYNNSLPREKHFNEREARLGTLGKMTGDDFLKKVGFVK